MNTQCLLVVVSLLAFCASPATAQRSGTAAKAYDQLRSTFNSAADAGRAARRQPVAPPKAPTPPPRPLPQPTWKPNSTPPSKVDLNSLRRPQPAQPSPNTNTVQPAPTPPPAATSGQLTSVAGASRPSAIALDAIKRTDTSKLDTQGKRNYGAQVRKAEDNLATSRAAVQRSNAEADALNKKKQNTDFVTEKKKQEGKANKTKRLGEKKFQEKKNADAKKYEETKQALLRNSTLNALSRSGAEIKKGPYTRAGHALTKHAAAQRFGNSKFPKLQGGPDTVNKMAQRQLDDILTGTGTVRSNVVGGNFSGGTRYTASDGRSAVFDSKSVFQYFGE